MLYIMIALAAWLAWSARGESPIWFPATLFVLQLAANALWTWLFFAWRLGIWSFVEIVVLWILIAADDQPKQRRQGRCATETNFSLSFFC